MRIAYLGTRGLPAQHGGFEYCVEKVSSALVRKGHRVTVYSKGQSTETQIDGVEIVHFPPSISNNKYIDDLCQNTLSTLHAWLRGYDVYHFFGTDAVLHTILPRLRRSLSVLTVDGAEWGRKSHPLIIRKILRLVWSWSAVFPSVLTVDNQQVIDSFSHGSGRVIHIPYGIEQYAKEGNSETPYILFVGRLVVEKGVDVLMKAFSSASTDMNLLIVGGVEANPTYAPWVSERRNRRIKLLGPIYGNEYWNLLSKAHVYVHPSRLEGMSTALLNALSCKRCIIATDLPENRAVLGDAALYYPPEDWKGLAEILSDISRDSRIVAEMERRSAHRLESVPTWEEVASRYEATYRLMLKQKGAVR